MAASSPNTRGSDLNRAPERRAQRSGALLGLDHEDWARGPGRAKTASRHQVFSQKCLRCPKKTVPEPSSPARSRPAGTPGPAFQALGRATGSWNAGPGVLFWGTGPNTAKKTSFKMDRKKCKFDLVLQHFGVTGSQIPTTQNQVPGTPGPALLNARIRGGRGARWGQKSPIKKQNIFQRQNKRKTQNQGHGAARTASSNRTRARTAVQTARGSAG